MPLEKFVRIFSQLKWFGYHKISNVLQDMYCYVNPYIEAIELNTVMV